MDWKGIGKAAALTARDMIGDAGTSLAHGFVDVGEAAVGLGGMMPPPIGPAVRWAANKSGYDPEATHQFLDNYYSPQTRQAMNAVENARGAGETIAALYNNPEALVYGVIRQAPGAAGGWKIGQAAINLTLYLCSAEPDYQGAERPKNPEPVKTKRGMRMFPASAPRFWDIGKTVGERLRRSAPRQTTEERNAPRPHLRRAHWHTFRIGEKRAGYRVRWLHPILVGYGNDHTPDAI